MVWHVSLLKLLPFFRVSDAEVVLFLHGVEAWQRRDWLTRKLLSRVNLFLSNTDYTWQRFLDANPRFVEALHQTVYLGIGAPWNGPAPKPPTPPVALMLGRLVKSEDYKGHREVLDAWPFVLDRLPEAELWIAGGGDLRGDLEQLAAARGLSSRVRFWGWISEERKQELISKCRCLVLPSRGEGFGLVYLEAMRLGRPCLVSTADAGREVVDPPNAGLAVDPDDLRQLADALTRLQSPGPEWDRWAANARQRYERHFTAEKFQQRLSEALAGAMIRRRARRGHGLT